MSHSAHWRYLGLDHKRAYQRNMTTALALVTIPLVLLMLIASLVNRRTSADHTVILRDALIVGRPLDSRSLAAGDEDGGRRVSESATIPLFGSDIAVVRERWRPMPGRLPRIFDHDDEFTEHSVDVRLEPTAPRERYFEVEIEIASGVGDYDFGLPVTRPFMPSPQRGVPTSLYGFGGFGTGSSGNRSGLIVFTGDLQWPAGAPTSDTGFVRLLVSIDPGGRLCDWKVVQDYPPGTGFARAVIQLLVDGTRIRPQVVNGRPITCRLEINTVVCHDCQLSATVRRGNFVVVEPEETPDR